MYDSDTSEFESMMVKMYHFFELPFYICLVQWRNQVTDIGWARAVS